VINNKKKERKEGRKEKEINENTLGIIENY
jgi:hypothetical protein